MEDTFKRPQQNVGYTPALSCFLSMKGCGKRSDVAYFRVQKYVDKGVFLLHSSVFRYNNKQISGTRKWISKK